MASFAQEAADFADGLEPERLVHSLWRVEKIRDQYNPFAMGLHRALARLENHRASNAPHPEIGMGRDVVDPPEDTPRPDANRPRRFAVQVCHVGPHPHRPRAFPPEAPQLFDDFVGIAEAGLGGLLSPDSEEFDNGAEQLVRVHGGAKGADGMNLASP